jgi:hypothetical protein
MTGDSPVTMGENGDVTVRGVTYEGTEGLWELPIKTKVDRSLVMRYMMSYKRILDSTSGHLSDNDPSGHIKTVRVPKYRDITSKLFPTEIRSWSRVSRQRQRWTTLRQ